MRYLSIFLAIVVSACSSAEDRALARVHELDARFDELEAKFDQVVAHYNYVRANCTEGPSCQRQIEDVQREGLILIGQMEDVARDQKRAERDFDYASAAADRRAAKGAALMAIGGGLLSAPSPRQPVICTTSNTSNPTTICQ